MQLIAPEILQETRGLSPAVSGTAMFVGLMLWLTGWTWHRFWVVLATLGIVALGFFHYMVWGYAMTQEVADEQAREAAQEWTNRQRDGASDHIQHKRF